MGGIVGGSKPKVDTSALEAQKKATAEAEARQAAAEAEKQRKEKAGLKAKQGRTGGNSLLSGLETGVTPVEGRRTSLG